MNALPSVAPIVAEHEAAQEAARSAVLHAIRCGELLLEAKAAVPHGEFGRYCEQLPFSGRTARAYMQLARLDDEKRQRVAEVPLRDALRYSTARNDDAAFALVFELIAIRKALHEHHMSAKLLAPPDDDGYDEVQARLAAAHEASRQAIGECGDVAALRAVVDAAMRVEGAGIMLRVEAARAVGRLLNGEPLRIEAEAAC